jgi:hypothetical protein
MSQRPPRHRPLERRHDWALAVSGVLAFAIGGYLLEGTVLTWPFLVVLGTFMFAVIQRYH